MIDNVEAKNFKGLSFSQNLKQQNIIVGKNGSGKSAISEGIMVAVNGHVPTVGKTNSAIIEAFSDNDKMSAGVSVAKTSFERRFVKNSKGKVSQNFYTKKGKVSKEAFISRLAEAGKPKIINLQEFLNLSSEKKTGVVFDLFPPRGDVDSLSEDIEKVSDELKKLTATIKQSEGIIEKLTADQAEIELPAGTLAEVNQEIERVTAEVKLARKNLFTAQKREMEAEAKEKAEREAAENAKKKVETEASEKADKEAENTKDMPGQEQEERRFQLGGDPGYTARNSEVYSEVAETETAEPSENPARISIWAIIKTMEKAGCSSCAAMLVAKRELRKY